MGPRRHAFDLRHIHFGHLEGWMGQAVGEVPVVGHQQQSRRVSVEPAYRKQPAEALGNQFCHHVVRMPIFQGGRVPYRLVKRNILFGRHLRQGDAVDGNRILRRVGAVPEDGGPVVNAHPALTNPLFRRPAGGQSC